MTVKKYFYESRKSQQEARKTTQTLSLACLPSYRAEAAELLNFIFSSLTRNFACYPAHRRLPPPTLYYATLEANER